MEIAERLNDIAVRLSDPCMLLLADPGIPDELKKNSDMVAAAQDVKVY